MQLFQKMLKLSNKGGNREEICQVLIKYRKITDALVLLVISFSLILNFFTAFFQIEFMPKLSLFQVLTL